jgi:hypothetical protein
VPTAATSATRAPLRARSTRTRGYRGPAAAPERLSFPSARARDEALHCAQRRVRALDLLSLPNDLKSDDAFRQINSWVASNENARDRWCTQEQADGLIAVAAPHLRALMFVRHRCRVISER